MSNIRQVTIIISFFMIYLICFLIITIYSWLFKFTTPNAYRKKLFCLIAFLHIGLIHALRDPYIYPDNGYYAESYELIGNQPSNEATEFNGWEPGWVLLNFFLYKAFHHPEFLFIVTSIIMTGGMMWLIYKISPFPMISIAIWLFYPLLFDQSMFVLRQHVASVIVLIAVYQQRTIWGLLFALVAVMFHQSAAIVIPFFFISYLRIKEITTMKFILLCVFAFLISNILYTFILPYTRFENYSIEANRLPFLLLTLLTILHIKNRTYIATKDTAQHRLLLFSAYGGIISCTLLGQSGGGRMSMYFLYTLPFVIPMLFSWFPKRLFLSKLAYVCLITLVTLYLIYSDGFNDYRFFF